MSGCCRKRKEPRELGGVGETGEKGGSLWLFSKRDGELVEGSELRKDLIRVTYQEDCFSTTWLPRWWSGKESAYRHRRCKRCGFAPWARKIPWSRKWQPTVVFLPGKFHGQRSLEGYSPWGSKESNMTEQLSAHTGIYPEETIIQCPLQHCLQ